MGEVKWTKEQKQAIDEKGSNLLIAAAAGSGKTAVLVERIIQKVLQDKVDIDELLVVTFTNAAASEMRERVLQAIDKKLEEEPENETLLRQITLLNKASICTIDSFCLEVVRNYFYELEGISPNFRIADTTEVELLKQEVLEDLFEKKYEEENEDFTKLIHTYTSYRDDTPLKELILKIYNYIQSNPFPEKWLKEKVEMFQIENALEKDFATTPWGKELLIEVEEALIDAIHSLERIEKKLSYEPELETFYQTIRNDIEMLEGLKNNLDCWDKAYHINQTLQFVTWPRKKTEHPLKEEAKEIRDRVKKQLGEVLDKILIYDSKQANQDIYDMYSILVKLEKLILEFENEFSKRKKEKNMVDFHDIEHFALQILLKEEEGKIVPSQVAKQYQEKFQEIAIDEYQDSNLVQEYILNAVSKGNNIFMVGDVKQSIYKFRQAMPELFLEKYRTYKIKEKKEKEDHLKVQLFKNFRSRENILDFTNLVFQNIMSNVLGDIEYNEEEYLNLGADYPELEEQNQKTQIHVLDLAKPEEQEKQEEQEEEEERIENIELEARFVANKIQNLIQKKYQVWDRKKNEYRDISYRDIVILLRSTSKTAPVYEQELLNLEIPVFSDSSQSYLDTIEIQTIMSLLKIIDNPMQDIPLVTVLRSYIGKFTDNELVKIRLSDQYDSFYRCMQKAIIDVEDDLKEKIGNFFNQLETWRKEQEYLSLDELIWKIYTDTGFYHYVGLMPNGELRQANLKMLFQKAKQYETASFKGLYNFINFIDQIHLSSGDLGSAKLIGENDDVVRIMSIHKSKGLEFPVVFLASTGKQFNLTDLNQDILLHQEMGIGVKYIDYDKQIQYDTLSKAAIKNMILRETLSEEMRILYVALTRAKEKLIITGTVNDYQKAHQKMLAEMEQYPKQDEKIHPILVKKYRKYLDWLLLTYEYEKAKEKEVMELEIHTKQEILKSLTKKEQEEVNVLEILENKKEDEKEIKKIGEQLNQTYPYQLATKIPTKASVTQLKQLEQESLKKEKQEIEFPKPNFLKEEKEEKISSMQKGSLVHLCLQHLDEKVEYDLEKIKKVIQELENKQIITQVEAKNINPYKILTFTKSEIWKELQQAKEVYKERPFYMNIPAKEIYHEETKETILVQGIIDLYYRNQEGKLVLVDYKTDYVEEGKEQELILTYQKQLELYKKGLEEAYKEKVEKVYLYSVYLGKAILLPTKKC